MSKPLPRRTPKAHHRRVSRALVPATRHERELLRDANRLAKAFIVLVMESARPPSTAEPVIVGTLPLYGRPKAPDADGRPPRRNARQ